MKAPEQFRERARPVGEGPQRCKVCGRADHIDFQVPDDVWERVVPLEFRKRVVCIVCFDHFASARNVPYMDSMEKDIYFAGDMGTFCAVIRSRSSADNTDAAD